MFKQPVQEAIQGDRVAMCVAALDAKELERGIVIGEKFPIPTVDACICVVHRLSYFKHPVPTKAKFHITLGHQTVMGIAHFFCPLDGKAAPRSTTSKAGPAEATTTAVTSGKLAKGGAAGIVGAAPSLAMGCGALVADRQRNWPTKFDFSANYMHLDELFQHGAPVEYENNDGHIVKLSPAQEPGALIFELNGEVRGEVTELQFDPNSGKLSMQGGAPLAATVDSRSVVPLKDRDRVIYLLRFLAQSCLVPGLPPAEGEPLAFVLLVLERPVTCPIGSLLIGSKLDFDIHSPNCRMAFFGRILCPMDPKDLKPLRIVKMKQKTGTLDRFDKQDNCVVICKDMFKADTDMSLFNGLKVVHEQSGIEGVVEGSFAQEGKFKVRFTEELKLKADSKGQVKGEERIVLYFKKHNFEEKSKRIVQ